MYFHAWLCVALGLQTQAIRLAWQSLWNLVEIFSHLDVSVSHTGFWSLDIYFRWAITEMATHKLLLLAPPAVLSSSLAGVPTLLGICWLYTGFTLCFLVTAGDHPSLAGGLQVV